MVLDFPISFIAPSFYKLDLSDLPCLIGGFAMGEIPGLLILIIKIMLKLLIKPSSTAFVGEITSFIFSASMIIPASRIYQKNKNKKGAIKAIVISSIIMVIVSIIGNYFFSIPFYSSLYHVEEADIIAMGKAIIPIINNKLSFVLLCVGPFNIIKAVIIDLLTIVLYKHISPLLKDR